MYVDEGALGNFLIDSRLMSRDQLDEVYARSGQTGESLYQALVAAGNVDEDELRRAAAYALGIPFVQLAHEDISPEALLILPEPLARSHSAVAYKLGDGHVEVAFLDLGDIAAFDALDTTQRLRVLPRLTDRASMKRGLLLHQKLLKEKFGALFQHGVNAADALIKHALFSGAHGVHLDFSTAGMLVRYRIGEGLHEAMQLPTHVGETMVERLKSLAKLFPVSTTPQAGKFKVDVDGEVHTIHMHAVPTIGGEKVHLRFTKESYGQKGFLLEALGLHGSRLEALQKVLHQKHGLVVVCGKEGSGKSTLLYTLLDMLNTPNRALATVEWEVEHHLPRVAQASVAGQTPAAFATSVRNALRQDPDVLMLSHVPSREVAVLAAQAAAHGKLVLVQVDAPSAIWAMGHLMELGISPALLTSTLKAVVATTLVNKLCSKTSDEQKMVRAEAALFEERGVNFVSILAALKEEGMVDADALWKDVTFSRPQGCTECEDGYKGVLGLQEVFILSETTKTLILQGAGPDEVEAQGREDGMLTLAEDGLFKAAQKLTSIEEVSRVS